MSSDAAPTYLTHHFLIAMPGLNDELFAKSVVYLCEHSARGALGLIVNKEADIPLVDLFDRLSLPLQRPDLQNAQVLRGGPLQTERGFVLHQPLGQGQPIGTDETPPAVAKALREAMNGLERALSVAVADEAEAPTETVPVSSAYAATLHVGGGLDLTTSRDVLEALSAGAGPTQVVVALGHASWGEGQLESELAENCWLTVLADPAVIFDTPVAERYARAMGLLGLTPGMLAPGAGHA